MNLYDCTSIATVEFPVAEIFYSLFMVDLFLMQSVCVEIFLKNCMLGILRLLNDVHLRDVIKR